MLRFKYQVLRFTCYALRFTFYALLVLCLSACTLTPTAAAPSANQLYVFDVSNLHLNHYEACLAATGQPSPCELKSPPAGKSYQDLLTDYDTLVFLATLQGVVNRDQPRLYLLHDHQRLETPGVDAFWLEKYQETGQPYGWLADAQIIKLKSLDEVLETFADDVEGVILWDPAVPATLNVATTIAGVENLAVLRDGSNLQSLIANYLKTKISLVGLFQPGAKTLPDSTTPSSGSPKTDAYLWAKEKYLDTGRANATFLAYLEDGWPATLYSRQQMTRGGVYALERDYVVQQRGFAFDLSPWADELPLDDSTQPLGADAATLKTIVEAANTQAGGALIKVWGFIPWYEKYAAPPGVGSSQHIPIKGEWESTWLFSEHGAYLQGGGGDVFGLAMANVSVHKFGSLPESRTAPGLPSEGTLQEKDYLTADGQVAPDHTFVMFYMGDYDLAHPVETLLANYASSPWQDSRRGEIPLAWGLNPGLVEDIPAIMNYLYSTQTDNDYFVAANSGAGYLNPDALSELKLLRWLWRSNGFYNQYGYNLQGFLLNGNGAAMSQRRLDAFTFLTPAGIITPDYEIDEPWPRLQLGTPLSAMATETLAGTPDVAAEAVHSAYRRVILEQGRPPFLAFRSSFQASTFLWGVRDRLQAQDAAGQIKGNNGEVLHPNYTVVDPYTFFALLERWLERPPTTR